MSDGPRALQAARPVDGRALHSIGVRLARQPEAPWLHRDVARRMAQRLPWIKRQPSTIVDWAAHAGGSAAALHEAYPRARIQPVEPLQPAAGPLPAPPAAGGWWRRWRGRPAIGSMRPPECPDGCADLVWSNMSLHLAADIPAVFAAWRRIAAVDGFLMFSTLGPGSFGLLRDLYREAGWGPALAPLVDMHDLGDLLVHAGFADPVMDQEMVWVTWTDPAALLRDLRAVGGNAAPDRHRGLRTPRWRAALCDALRARRDDQGRVSLGFEVVYGHAFCPPPRVRADGTTAIPVEQMRAMARAGRGGRSAPRS